MVFGGRAYRIILEAWNSSHIVIVIQLHTYIHTYSYSHIVIVIQPEKVIFFTIACLYS